MTYHADRPQSSDADRAKRRAESLAQPKCKHTNSGKGCGNVIGLAAQRLGIMLCRAHMTPSQQQRVMATGSFAFYGATSKPDAIATGADGRRWFVDFKHGPLQAGKTAHMQAELYRQLAERVWPRWMPPALKVVGIPDKIEGRTASTVIIDDPHNERIPKAMNEKPYKKGDRVHVNGRQSADHTGAIVHIDKATGEAWVKCDAPRTYGAAGRGQPPYVNRTAKLEQLTREEPKPRTGAMRIPGGTVPGVELTDKVRSALRMQDIIV